MHYDVVALGELLIDFACTQTDADGYPVMAAHPGGAPANFLAALTRFGAKTAMIGKVGRDTFGELLIGTLQKAGIGTEGLIASDDVFTTLAFVTFDPDGDRHFSFARKPGADTCLTQEEVSTDLIDRADVLHFGTLSLTSEPSRGATRYAVAYAKEHGKLLTFDPNLRKPLWGDLAEAKEQMLWGLHQADVVKISDEEVTFLFGNISYEDAAQRLLTEFGVRLAFVTLGKNGCLYANRNAVGTVPALTGLHTIDTTGAGDIFGGSAVWKLLQTGKAPEALEKAELEQVVRFACTSAGLSTELAGGISSVPSLETVLSRAGL